jgi:hypothetical protein
MTTNTDTATGPDSVKTIANMSEQEHIFYLLRRIPRNNEWKVILELMMDRNATMTATPNEIVTKLVEMEAAFKRENVLAPDALLFARRVTEVLMVVMVVLAVKPVKSEEVQRRIREMI